MPTHIPAPTRIEAAGNKPKLIDEYVGRVTTKTEAVSVAHMRSPAGWVEPGQTPEFSEYTVVHPSQCAVISKKANLDKVGLLGCGVATGYYAVRTMGVRRGSTVVVWGLGGVGAAVVMGAKAAGASRIVGIDMNEKKADSARALARTSSTARLSASEPSRLTCPPLAPPTDLGRMKMISCP